jgi:glycosyltransferase involved in cell wall biosynthesis
VPVVVVAPRGPGQPGSEVLDGIPVYRFDAHEGVGAPGILREYAEALARLPPLLLHVWRVHRPAVIQFCNPPDIFFPYGLAWRMAGGRFVFDHHDLAPEMCEARFRGLPGRLAVGLTRLAEWLTFRSANAIITTNESYAEIARRRGGVPAAKIHVVRNGPDIRRFSPRPLPSTTDRLRIVTCVGVCGHEDGWDVLVQAARTILLDRRRMDVRLVMIGDGPLLPSIRQEVRELGLTPYVELTGWIGNDAEIVERLAASDVCVVPEPSNAQNDRSTFIKTMEYMALGRPVVAFDLVETRRSAADAARYGRPNDPGSLADAIISVLDDPEDAARMAALGAERVRTTLSWQVQGERYLATIREELHRAEARRLRLEARA